MCMTLALSLGLRFGLRKTLWMMIGELIGVGTVVVASAVGVAGLLLLYPWLFVLLKLGGGCYLAWLGSQLLLSRGKMALNEQTLNSAALGRMELAAQGFVTAIANPKGWAFFIALLPPFLDASRPLFGQLTVLTALILIIEAICLLLYASGGKTLAHLLKSGNAHHLLNRVSGLLLCAVAVWLMLS